MRTEKHPGLCRILLGVEVLFLALINNIIGLTPEILGGRPLVLIAAALTISVCENASVSAVFGAVCGALSDLSFSGGIGFYSFALTVSCYVVSSLLQSRLRSNFVTAALLVFAAVFALITTRYLLFSFSFGLPDSAFLYVRHGISKIILTYFSAFPLYFLNRLLILCLTGKKDAGGAI